MPTIGKRKMNIVVKPPSMASAHPRARGNARIITSRTSLIHSVVATVKSRDVRIIPVFPSAEIASAYLDEIPEYLKNDNLACFVKNLESLDDHDAIPHPLFFIEDVHADFDTQATVYTGSFWNELGLIQP